MPLDVNCSFSHYRQYIIRPRYHSKMSLERGKSVDCRDLIHADQVFTTEDEGVLILQKGRGECEDASTC